MKCLPKPTLRSVFTLCIPIIALYIGFPAVSKAQSIDPNLYIGTIDSQTDLFTLSARWNDTVIASSSTIHSPLQTQGTLQWSLSYDPATPNLQRYVSTLDNGVYTIQLYKGEVGDSTLIGSELIPYAATSSGSFEVSFPHTGQYFLAYAVIYPPDTYPLGTRENCPTSACILPKHLFNEFQNFVTKGQSDTTDFGYIPAETALLPFRVESDGPNASNVLFIPGTMESRLYTKDVFNNEKMLWEPTRNANVAALAMNANGQSKSQIYTRDIVDYLYSSTPLLHQAVAAVAQSSSVLYGPFEDYMNGLVSKGIIKQWRAYPYDWRYDVSDIVQDGTLVGSAGDEPHTVYIEDEIRDLASQSPTGQVTIVAHSNGGLLAKAVAVDLEKKNELDLLDKIIMVGTPQVGTPSAIGDELHGDGQTRVLGIVTSGDTSRQTGTTLPGPYDLLPSEAYFSYVATPVVSFGTDDTEAPYRNSYGTPITSYAAFRTYLTDSAGVHAGADTKDLSLPATMSGTYVEKAHATHQAIDAWVPPNNLSLISISGIGQPTISGYTYGVRDEKNCALKLISLGCSTQYVLTHVPTITSQGDDTVVSVSAGANPDTGLYFDARRYKDDSGTSIVHQSLLSAQPVQDEIQEYLTGSGTTSPYVSATLPPYQLVPEVVVSTHSPVTITATDKNNRVTGITPIPGTDFPVVREGIPDSFVETLDDEKYLYLPVSNDTYQFAVQGYDNGTTTIELGTTEEDGRIRLIDSYIDLQTTPSTSASFSLKGTSLSSLALDTAGDGSTMAIEPTSRATVASSSPATISASGTSLPSVTGSRGSGRVGQLLLPSGRVYSSAPTSLSLRYLQLLLQLLQLKVQLMKLLSVHKIRNV